MIVIEKILDFLNKREFKINTSEGARDALMNLLSEDAKRISHTLGVVKLVEQLCEERNWNKADTELALQCAYLHDIGYSEKFKFMGFHPSDGFYYLKSNGWNTTVCKVALHHTYAELLVKMSRSDLVTFYSERQPTEQDRKFIELITEADLQTSAIGERVTIDERVEDIKSRYGSDSVITKHIEEVRKYVNL